MDVDLSVYGCRSVCLCIFAGVCLSLSLLWAYEVVVFYCCHDMVAEYFESVDDGCRPRLPRVAKSRESSGLQVRQQTDLTVQVTEFYEIFVPSDGNLHTAATATVMYGLCEGTPKRYRTQRREMVSLYSLQKVMMSLVLFSLITTCVNCIQTIITCSSFCKFINGILKCLKQMKNWQLRWFITYSLGNSLLVGESQKWFPQENVA